MSTGQSEFDWGQPVRVRSDAPIEMHPGEIASVCGIRSIENEQWYLIEFGNGFTIEVPSMVLESLGSCK